VGVMIKAFTFVISSLFLWCSVYSKRKDVNF
jgi:hypothetical protein